MARWLWVGLFVSAFLPSAWLAASALQGATDATWGEVFYRPFLRALAQSGRQVLWVSLLGFALGWPYGVVSGLFRYPFKRLCLALLLLPLVMPPFLWAIGLQGLKPFVSFARQSWLDGFSGCVLSYSTQVFPLVALAAMAQASLITASEREAALVGGGIRHLLRQCLRATWPSAAAAAVVGGVLTLSDPGCGQITGSHGVASVILTALSARNDFAVASLKALSAGLLVLPAVAFAAIVLARKLHGPAVRVDFGRTADIQPGSRWAACWTGLGMLTAAGMFLLPAFAGLVRPLAGLGRGHFLRQAGQVMLESAAPTAWYGVGAALTAVLLGLVIAAGVGHSRLRFRLVFALGLGFLALPSALHALGVVSATAAMPAPVAALLRSEIAVGAAIGWRFVPLAAILLALAWRRLSRSMLDARRVHAVPAGRFLLVVALPVLWRPVIGVFVLVALLALADVSTTMLLQPPGASSYGTRLFAVMDNSPEKLVAALCLGQAALPLLAVAVHSVLAILIPRRT
ncbi:MAG: hypothetical protein NTW21_12720 [Verrucomicrobia bacterium]|nr:hypothetical protein [Verrucomicrobiota bacterium]